MDHTASKSFVRISTNIVKVLQRMRERKAAELYAVKREKPLIFGQGAGRTNGNYNFTATSRFPARGALRDMRPPRGRQAWGKTIRLPVSIYTDGSKIEDKVDCTFTCKRNGHEVLSKKNRQTILHPGYRECNILSDSLSFLDAIANLTLNACSGKRVCRGRPNRATLA